MPLDQAVYIPEVGPRAAFIAGVRGGRVFQFDASSGSKVSETQFYSPGGLFGCIAYWPDNDQIYLGVFGAHNSFTDTNTSTPDYRNNLYTFDPGFSSAAVNVHIENIFLDGFTSDVPIQYNFPLGGVFRIVPCGEWLGIVTNPGHAGLGLFKPATPTIYIGSSNQSVFGYWFREMCYVAADDRMWISEPEVPRFGIYDWVNGNGFNGPYPAALFPHYLDRYYVTPFFSPTWPYGRAPDGTPPRGMCSSDVTHCLYISTGTQIVAKYDITGNTFSSINLARSDARPVTIRYNPVDELVYVPTWADNTVCVINPSDDSFVVKSGFDCPVDIVFTPTKKFAVQRGSAGLKEIV